MLDAPICRVPEQTLYASEAGEQLQVHCEFDADPPDLQFNWTHTQLNHSESLRVNTPNKRINRPANKLNNFSHNGSSSSLLYQLTEWTHFGELRCTASNSVGAANSPCVIRVQPHGPPCSPRECHYENGVDHIRLTCEPCAALSLAGAPAAYNLRVYQPNAADRLGSLHALAGDAEIDGLSGQPLAAAQADLARPSQLASAHLIHNLTTSGLRPEFTISQLKPDSAYLLLLAAYNRRGSSPVKSFSINTLPLLQPSANGL